MGFMHRLRLPIFCLTGVALACCASAPVLAGPNPAAEYAESLGYEYKVIDGPAGARGVVRVEPGVEFDAWDFMKGKVGRKYSYSGLHGYTTECVRETNGACVVEYAVCTVPGTGVRETRRVPVLELMKERGDLIQDDSVRRHDPFSSFGDVEVRAAYDPGAESRAALPDTFAWTNINGHTYIGSIRDQGGCGSCYAFGACAAAEGTYNKAMGYVDGDCVDFSESFIIWCLGRLSEYNSHFFGCDGADYDYYEIQALTNQGVTYESNFPYQEDDPGSCTHYDDPTVVFSSWARVACSDTAAIKSAITNYGVVAAAVNTDTAFNNYSSGIYENTDTDCDASPCYYETTDHVISLIGWDDSPPEGGGGVWILRNSWGSSWGENGYMRIRYTSAAVACAVAHLAYDETPVVTAADDAYSVEENGTLVVADPGVLDNDTGTGALSAIVVSNVNHGALSLSTNGGFSYTPSTNYAGTDSFVYRASDASTSDTAVVTLTVSSASPVLFSEGFEDAFVNGAPPGWSRSFKTGSAEWGRGPGGYDGNPASAYTGTYNATLYAPTKTTQETYLITPAISFSPSLQTAILTFQHAQAAYSDDQDTLEVYTRTSATGTWQLAASYLNEAETWTARQITLTNLTSTYYVGFLGQADWGYGVCLDHVEIRGGTEGPYTVTLQIASDHGSPRPAAGLYTNDAPARLTNVVNLFDTQTTTQYVCTGWSLSGNPATNGAYSGTTTNVILNQTNDAVLTWQWTTNYWLSAQAGPHGSVPPTSGWYAAGQTVSIPATPEAGYHFSHWTGDVAGPDTNSNPLELVMDTAREVTAAFAQGAGPSWWYRRSVVLADGPTNDYAAVNQGQVKWMASQAHNEFANSASWNAGGTEETLIQQMISGFSPTNNYLAASVGQVKAAARPFHDWLGARNGVTNYPWGAGGVTNDYGVANIGQLKNAFDFSIEN